MDKTTTSDALSSLGCAPCGIGSAELAAFLRHIDHIAAGLAPEDERRLRGHLFALLAAVESIDLASRDANEYPLLTTGGVGSGSLPS